MTGPDFLTTTAQVIPVLVLALAVEFRSVTTIADELERLRSGANDQTIKFIDMIGEPVQQMAHRHDYEPMKTVH